MNQKHQSLSYVTHADPKHTQTIMVHLNTVIIIIVCTLANYSWNIMQFHALCTCGLCCALQGPDGIVHHYVWWTLATLSIWMEVNYMSKIRNRKRKNRMFQPRRSSSAEESPQLMKTLEVKTCQVFILPVAYFAHIIDFHSYADATMSPYSIIFILTRSICIVWSGDRTPCTHCSRMHIHTMQHCIT